jgi:hypothetical protein
MPNPGNRERFGVGTRNDELGHCPSERSRVRVRATWISPPFDQRPLEEIQKAMDLSVGPWIPESASWLMMSAEA